MTLRNNRRPIIILMMLCGVIPLANALTARYRCMWREDPATSMVIGWDQVSGGNAVLYYDLADFGREVGAYRFSQKTARVTSAKGMNNHFVRLRNLKPNTVYYFIIKDSEGYSRRFSFKTVPNSSDERLSVIAGGDSRNHRDARISANRLVSKLRPHCIMFAGDMTANDNGGEWQDWFDDWQKTIGSDGRLFPIIVARGNHEASNQSLVDLFDVPAPEMYYELVLGGDLLQVYTLNSLIAPGGNQKNWLLKALQDNTHIHWKFAQYHHAIRPHTAKKPEQNELLLHWATLFHKYSLDVAVESDAHVVKSTYPIRPSNEPGSAQGFIRDDENGTVYLGEGCWGAPLRVNNDNKPWTRNSGSFNQFKWIFIDREKVEIRTIKTMGAGLVAEVDHYNIFETPPGLVIWRPGNGEVITLYNKKSLPPTYPEQLDESLADDNGIEKTGTPAVFKSQAELEIPSASEWPALPKLLPDPKTGFVRIKYILEKTSDVIILLVNPQRKEVSRIGFKDQFPGPYLKSLDLKRVPKGRYFIVVKVNGRISRRYRVQKW